MYLTNAHFAATFRFLSAAGKETRFTARIDGADQIRLDVGGYHQLIEDFFQQSHLQT